MKNTIVELPQKIKLSILARAIAAQTDPVIKQIIWKHFKS